MTHQPDPGGSAVEPMMRALSEYVADALHRPLPAEVAEKAKHHMLDTFAAMVVGAGLKPGQLGVRFAAAQGGVPECTVAGSGHRTNAVNAAFANGMLAGAGETDDSHYLARMHPGCAVVPPALAVAERQDLGGEALLRAVVLGYDIGTRLTMSLDEALLDAAFHSPHSIGGLFGGTAACAALLGLDVGRVRYALSFAAQQAAGVTCWMRDPEHVEKAFVFGGNPGRNAVSAALMVEAGFTGNADPFHGQHNFFDSFSPRPDRTVMVRGLGTEFEVMRAMIKKWTVGSPIQAALDSAQALLRENRLRPGDIARVTVTMPDKEFKIVNDRHMPEICMQHLVSLMLVDGDVTLESSHDHARMTDPAVVAIRESLTLVPDAAMTRTPPPRQARVAIETTDGRRLSHHTAAVRGTPDNPMTRAEVEAKALGLMVPRIGDGAARAIVDATWRVDQVRVRDLAALLAAGGSRA